MAFKNYSPRGIAWAVRRHGLELGTAATTKRPVRLALDWLATGLHVIGPTGSGKSRLLLHLLRQLITLPRSTVIVLSPKGAFGRMARDLCIQLGLVPRLTIFDPSDPDFTVGYNPLRPNALSIATQAKAVRDAVLAGHGQTDTDKTQQLARHLLLALYAARERELTLVEAASLLRAGSRLRPAVLGALNDPVMREALEHFHRLRPERQDQLAASTLARLETATTDPLLRRILSHSTSLDLSEVIRNHGILIVDVRQYQPLRPTDVKFLGRLLVNDLLAHIFARTEATPDPVYLVIDEVEVFATEDLSRAFDQARELGLRTIVGHQHLEQLILEGNRQLRVSVDTDLRSKIVFGGLPVAQLEELVPDLFLEAFDPRSVKDELTHLELDPVETRRAVPTFTIGSSRGTTFAHSKSVSAHYARSVAHTLSASHTQGTARTQTHGHAMSEGEVATVGDGAGLTSGVTVLPDCEVISSHNLSDIHHTGTGWSQSTITSESTADTDTRTDQFGESDTWTRSRGGAHTRGDSTTKSSVGSVSTSVSHQPFYEYRKRRVPSSRTFWTREEFLTEWVKTLRRLPQAHFVAKVPGKPAVAIRAAFVPTPRVSDRLLLEARARLRTLPCSLAHPELPTRPERPHPEPVPTPRRPRPPRRR